MLHHISWFTYAVTVGAIAACYYLYMAITYYRTEFKGLVRKLSGKQAALVSTTGDFILPEDTITGQAQPDAVDFVAPEDLSFGPTEVADTLSVAEFPIPSTGSSRLAGIFTDMIAEVKTLIRVINESGESKENFEMLFRLIIVKYSELAGTAYQSQINDFLLTEGAPEFPFSLTATDLEHYWTTDFKETAA